MSPGADETAGLKPGATFAGYTVERMIGRGGMGVVYEASESALDRRVALKVIGAEAAADPVFLDRFRQESKVAAQVEHPNVTPIYAVGEEGGLPFIAMRFVPGPDLDRKIKTLRRLEPEDAAAVIAHVAAGLDAIHATGLIHRDVKPANILLSGEEGREHAYITDFGLAKHVASVSELTRGGLVMGTVDYVSPEQIRPGGIEVDAATDVYALGCVLYKTLTGEVPFPGGDGAAKMWAHVHEEVPRPSVIAGVPAAFDPVIARAMAKDPRERFPSAGDLGRAAEAAATGRPVTEPERRVANPPPPGLVLEEGEGTTADLARRYAAAEQTRVKPSRRTGLRRVLVPALIGLAVGGGASAGFLLNREESSGAPAEVAELIARADTTCAQSRRRFNRIAAPAPVNPREAARQADQLVEISSSALFALSQLPAPAEVEESFGEYLALRRSMVNQLRTARNAATRNDLTAYEEILENIDEGAAKRFDAARDVGLTQCSRSSGT